MKKSSMSVLTVSVCIALSAASFALPCFAKNDLDRRQGIVMERETPKEYMADFYALAQAEDESVIFLTETQISQLVATAEQAYRDELGIDIPEGLEFECTANRHSPEDSTVYIFMNWTGSTDEQQPIRYNARFENTDFPTGQASLMAIGAGNGFDTKHFEAFEESALDALKSELDLSIPSNYSLTSTYLSFEGGQKKLNYIWSNPVPNSKRADGTPISTEVYYSVMYDSLDIKKATGRITAIEKFYEFTQQSIMEERNAPGFVEITDIKQNEMLESAKQFLDGKGIDFGNLRRSLQVTFEGEPVMWFTFEAFGLNDSQTGSVTVTISPGLKIMGYRF